MFSVGRFGFFGLHKSPTVAEQMCNEYFGGGRLLEITSQEEYQAVRTFVGHEQLVMQFQIADQTSPASRGIGKSTLYEYGEYNMINSKCKS